MDYVAARKQEPKYVGHPFSKVRHEPMSPFTLDQYGRTCTGSPLGCGRSGTQAPTCSRICSGRSCRSS
jgi:hypothetical protein